MDTVSIICCGLVIILNLVGAISDDQKIVSGCHGVAIGLINYVILRSMP